jgi:hypothetical protein
MLGAQSQSGSIQSEARIFGLDPQRGVHAVVRAVTMAGMAGEVAGNCSTAAVRVAKALCVQGPP